MPSEIIPRGQNAPNLPNPEQGFYGVVDALAYRPSPGMTFEQWQHDGEMLAVIGHSMPWWIGDWYNAGEVTYGEHASAASAIGGALGIAPRTVQTCGSIAARIPSTRRRAISFSHHREVAYLAPEQADALLTTAQQNELTVRELRDMVKRKGSGVVLREVIKDEVTCPECGHHFSL
jgi:hypothetical protein